MMRRIYSHEISLYELYLGNNKIKKNGYFQIKTNIFTKTQGKNSQVKYQRLTVSYKIKV